MKALHLAPPYPSCFSISRPTLKTTKLPETTRLLSERQSGTTSRVLHRRCCSDGAKPASSLPQAHDSWRYPDKGEVWSRDGRGDTLARPSDLPPAEQTEQISGLDVSGDSASAKLVAAHWGGLHDALETRWTVEDFVGCTADRQLGGFLVSGGGGAFTAPAIRWPHVPAPGVRYSSQP